MASLEFCSLISFARSRDRRQTPSAVFKPSIEIYRRLYYHRCSVCTLFEVWSALGKPFDGLSEGRNLTTLHTGVQKCVSWGRENRGREARQRWHREGGGLEEDEEKKEWRDGRNDPSLHR